MSWVSYNAPNIEQHSEYREMAKYRLKHTPGPREAEEDSTMILQAKSESRLRSLLTGVAAPVRCLALTICRIVARE